MAVLLLESKIARLFLTSKQSSHLEEVYDWDPSGAIVDATGVTLADEIVRKCRELRVDKSCSSLVITMPGTLARGGLVVSSSRLNIKQNLQLGERMQRDLGVSCQVFHDLECLGRGEIEATPGDFDEKTVLYVFADEGLGAKVYVNGRVHLGSGIAGTIGRLVLDPEGSYYPAFEARGALESYVSRPWVSQRIVTAYGSERKKRGAEELDATPFRRRVRAASDADPEGLDYADLVHGLTLGDPLAEYAMNAAARRLAQAISASIALLGPHLILLGGRMFTDVQWMASAVVIESRSLVWPLAWNNTEMRVGTSDRTRQVMGAMMLFQNEAGD